MRNNTDPVLVAGLHQHSWSVNKPIEHFCAFRAMNQSLFMIDLLFWAYVTFNRLLILNPG